MNRYEHSVQVLDNFFSNPYKIMELGNSLEYYRDETWPGERTTNLLQSNNKDAVELAKFFARKLANTVLYGLSKFELDVRFHKNDLYDDPKANCGWIHNDEIDFAGLVYLNAGERSMKTGTSIFDKISQEAFKIPDYTSRKELNVNKKVTEQYLIDLENNHKQFLETVCIANKFNRLITYDATQWHRPNNYEVEQLPRYSLLFFINNVQFANLESIVTVNSTWSDV